VDQAAGAVVFVSELADEFVDFDQVRAVRLATGGIGQELDDQVAGHLVLVGQQVSLQFLQVFEGLVWSVFAKTRWRFKPCCC
jgi:hypothetical protein